MSILTRYRYVKSIVEGRLSPLPTPHLPLKDARLLPLGILAEIALGASPNTTFERRRDAARAIALRCGPSDYYRVGQIISDAIKLGTKSELSFKPTFNLEPFGNIPHFIDILIRQTALDAAAQIGKLHSVLAAEFWQPVVDLACSDRWAHKVNQKAATDLRIQAFKEVLPTLLKSNPHLASESFPVTGTIAAVLKNTGEDSSVRVAASDFLDVHLKTCKKLKPASTPNLWQQMNAAGVIGNGVGLDDLIKQVGGASFARPAQSVPGIIRPLFHSAQPS